MDFNTLCQTIDSLIDDEYQFCIFNNTYSNDIHISLSKKTNGSEVKVEANGKNIVEAATKAISQFPRHPLAGGAWESKRLSAPTTADDEISF